MHVHHIGTLQNYLLSWTGFSLNNENASKYELTKLLHVEQTGETKVG